MDLGGSLAKNHEGVRTGILDSQTMALEKRKSTSTSESSTKNTGNILTSKSRIFGLKSQF